MKKSLITLILLPCLLLSACGKATETATTSATTETPQNSLPAEERYTDEVGRYVCKNVAINAEMEQYFVPYQGYRASDTPNNTSIGCFIKDFEESTVAVVKKIASESYYTAYEDGRTPLAYTLSTIEIVSLPEGARNAFGMQVGDSVTIVEPYAFSPDNPDVIYRSNLIYRYSYDFGIMEMGNTYLVNLIDIIVYNTCYETDKEPSETLVLPETYYSVAADIYSIDKEIYEAWISDSAVGDLAIPTTYSKQSLQRWNTVYQWAYEQYVTD
ncbi:MAG: hypothetical protein IJX47_07870 [Clostridia bacterium]|nr:hypothetical protein [Clostridia bacterium]